MTAAELIAVLKAHPKACWKLGIIDEYKDGVVFRHADLMSICTHDFDPREPRRFLNWLTGAAANEFVRRGWYLPNPTPVGVWVTFTATEITQGDSLLHALLAAIEAAEETSNG